jgi:hypothetical protein
LKEYDYLIWAITNKDCLSPIEKKSIANLLKKGETMNHIDHLKYEIEVLKSRIREHGTGHFHTTISVLESRIEELRQKPTEVLDSAYPDGDGYWQ